MSKDFDSLTQRYDANATLILNNRSKKTIYLGTQISDYWLFFFSRNAVEAYTISSIERDRHRIKANIVAEARSSKGRIRELCIFHQLEINYRGKIVKERWAMDDLESLGSK